MVILRLSFSSFDASEHRLRAHDVEKTTEWVMTTRMTTDSLVENTPKAHLPNWPKRLGYRSKKASLGVRNPCIIE